MKKSPPPKTAATLETHTMRELLARISTEALATEVETSLEQTTKLTSLIVNLTKTIRETEIHNEKLDAAATDSSFTGSLEDRLKGYKPTGQERKDLQAKLKERLQVMAPRIVKDDNRI